MVDSRRDVAGQAGRSPSPSVQATMIGLMAILLWSLMTGLVRVVADGFGATLGSALIYTCGAVLLLVFRRPAPLRKYPRTYLIVGGLLLPLPALLLLIGIGIALLWFSRFQRTGKLCVSLGWLLLTLLSTCASACQAGSCRL